MAERTLINDLKSGCEKAYIQIVEQYGNKLLRTCYLLLNDKEEAEDVVQETFIKVFKKINTFREDSEFYTWVYKIALNLSKDKLRRRKDYIELHDEFAGQEDLNFEIEKSIDRELLKNELNKINSIYKEILVLFYFEEFSIKEISRLLSEKEGTVKSRLSRGRNILKEKLLKGGHFSD